MSSAIAFTDALTAKHGGRINQQDHSGAHGLLRSILGNRFPKAQETHLRRILAQKDTAQYSARYISLDEARTMLEHLEQYALWAAIEFDR